MSTPPMPDSPRPRRWRAWIAGGIAAVLVLAAAAGLQWQRREEARRAAAILAYDVEAAMQLAGGQVPPEVESFYFFVLDAAAPGEALELAEKLAQAAGEQEFLGIVGADTTYNRVVLLDALASHRDRQTSLAGLVIIYVGPPEQEAELAPIVGASGAEFRFVPYEPETVGAI